MSSRHFSVVTGASGTLGSHFAMQLAAGGSDIILAGRNLHTLSQMSCLIERSWSVMAVVVPIDLALDDPVATISESLRRLDGKLGMLINCAGVATASSVGSGREPLNMVRVNLQAPIELCEWAAAKMLASSQGGNIINVASIAALVKAPFVDEVYVKSKVSLLQYSLQLAGRYRAHGLKVSASCPAIFRGGPHKVRTKTRIVDRVPKIILSDPACIARISLEQNRMGNPVIVPCIAAKLARLILPTQSRY